MARSWERTRARMARLIARFRRSGRTRAEFARAAGITTAKLDYWKRRVARTNVQAPRTPGFVPVQLAVDGVAERAAGDLEIVLRNGERVRVGQGVSAERLRELLAALRE